MRAGKVRYIGSSSFAAWQMVESLWVAKEYGLNRFVCEQPAYNLLDRRAERELFPMAQTYGIGIIPWSPTAGGFLTGKYARGEAAPQDSRFERFWKGEEGRHGTEAAYAVLDLITQMGAEKGAPPFQIALAWVMQQPGVTSPIIGPRTVQHTEDALKAAEIRFGEDDLKRIDAAAPPGRAIVPYYGYDGMAWVRWGPHKQRW